MFRALISRSALWAGLFALMGVASAPAAVLYLEDFSVDDGGWFDMNGGTDWEVNNPGGTLEGYFYVQDTPAPETDAWRATGSGNSANFTGNYWTGAPGFTAWRFSFYAANVLPSDLTLRFGSGANSFMYSLTDQVTTYGNWLTITVPLTYSVSWFGGTAAQFSNALSNVTYIDVQVSRSSSEDEYYYMDNFELTNVSIASAIPEPATGLFWFGTILLYGLRKHIRGTPEPA